MRHGVDVGVYDTICCSKGLNGVFAVVVVPATSVCYCKSSCKRSDKVIRERPIPIVKSQSKYRNTMMHLKIKSNCFWYKNNILCFLFPLITWELFKFFFFFFVYLKLRTNLPSSWYDDALLPAPHQRVPGKIKLRFMRWGALPSDFSPWPW